MRFDAIILTTVLSNRPVPQSADATSVCLTIGGMSSVGANNPACQDNHRRQDTFLKR